MGRRTQLNLGCFKVPLKPTFWIVFGFLCVWEVVILGLTIHWVTDRRLAYGTESTEFALYKNTRFHECSTQPRNTLSIQPNCSYLQLDNRTAPPLFLKPDYWQGIPSPSPNDWCTLSTCFEGFKIVPSRPRGSAFPLTALNIWLAVNWTVLTSMWSVRKHLLRDDEHDVGYCYDPRISVGDYAGYAADLVTVVYWWTDFGLKVRAGENGAIPSFFAWLTSWRYVFQVNNHPLGCVLDQKGSWERALANVIAYLLAAAAFLATFVLAVFYAGDVIHLYDDGPQVYIPRYDCDVDLFDRAPGTSNCSMASLCEGNRFPLVDTSIPNLVPGSSIFVAHIVFFYMAFLALIVSSGFLLVRAFRLGYLPSWANWMLSCLGEPGSEQDSWGAQKLAFFRSLPALPYLVLTLLAPLIVHDIFRWDSAGNEGLQSPIMYDGSCRALHIPMSPWRQYMDVNGYGQAARIARSWFSA